jgi:signal transduction histidine kinase
MGKIAVCWLAVIVSCFLYLTPQAMAQETVDLLPDTQHAEIYDKIWFLFDDTSAMTLDQVRATPERFQRNTRHGLNFGDVGPVIWLRLEVQNTGARDREWLLATRLSTVNIFDVYQMREGRAELIFSAANQDAIMASLRRHDQIAAAFSLMAKEQATLFIRFRGEAISRIPMAIQSFEAVAGARQQKYVIFYSIAASVGALAFYSCAIFLIIGGRAILYYAAAEVTIVLLLAQFFGILNIHLWPDSVMIRDDAPSVLNALNVIFTALFVRSFFRLKGRSSRADRFFRALIFAAVAYLFLTAILFYAPKILFDALQYIPYILATAMWGLLPPLALYATLRWRRSYWPFIPGWFSVLFAHVYWILIVLNLAPEPPFHPQLLGLNAIVQALFLAVAIVLEVRQLRDDGLRGQLDLNAALQQQLAAAEQNAVILRELAEQDRLVHAAGHDSRSILLGLRNFAVGLGQGADAAHVSVAAQAITHLTDDLEAVLSTTIASAAHSGGENVLALESVPLAQVLSAVRLIHERMIREKELRFTVHGGDFTLVTDRPLLARIVGNLVDNARNYTEQGGIILAARCVTVIFYASRCGIAVAVLRRRY